MSGGTIMQQMNSVTGTWKCFVCNKQLSRKQRYISHMKVVHSIRDIFQHKQYKLYKNDPSIPIPSRTMRRQHHQSQMTCDYPPAKRSNQHSILDEREYDSATNVECLNNIYDPSVDFSHAQPVSGSQEIFDVCMNLNDSHFTSEESSSSHSETISEAELKLVCNNYEEKYDVNHKISSNNDMSFDTSSSDCYESNTTAMNLTQTVETPMNSKQEKYVSIRSYMLRYKLNKSARSNLLKLFNIVNESVDPVKMSELNESLGDLPEKYYDTCEACGALFPDDESVYCCPTTSCKSLRYKGNESNQTKKVRKCFFVTLSLEQQMQDLFSRPGVWKAVTEKPKSIPEIITDITTSAGYKNVIDALSDTDSHIFTLCYNTDGALLYKSTSVNLWPVFLVVNELPPKLRFSRKNMLLWGLWQGKGKPNFNIFFTPFVRDMNHLHDTGFTLSIDGSVKKCRAILLLGTADLQAKAPLLCMSHHNGEFGCITCETPGKVVKSSKSEKGGKCSGNVRYYPYERSPDFRTTESVVQIALGISEQRKNKIDSEAKKTRKGIKNVSPLLGMKWFDIIKGSVPDYMHGILLGVTKKLCTLWFSKKYKKKAFSIMHETETVDQQLTAMKPLDTVSRLPRSFAANLTHWKATEFELWLLYYSLPCLVDILPEIYLTHYSKFISSIYSLLGDSISTEAVQNAKENLKSFYEDFSELYGPENCGLNVHNAGQHLADYVRMWGPIWAWSCFGFEDMNGNLLDNVHGSGNVCAQALKLLQAQKVTELQQGNITSKHIRAFINDLTRSNVPKNLKLLNGCHAAGALQDFIISSSELLKKMKGVLGYNVNLNDFWKVLRIVLQDKVIFSSEYSRMERRISYFVLIENPDLVIARIQFFLVHKQSKDCLAIAREYKVNETRPFLLPNLCHLIQIEPSETDLSAFNVKNIKEKVMYINGNPSHVCVARMPNLHGLSH